MVENGGCDLDILPPAVVAAVAASVVVGIGWRVLVREEDASRSVTRSC